MMFENFSVYDDCEPLGVELPKTSVSEAVLSSIGLDKESSTKEIMYELARKGLRDKGIINFSIRKSILIAQYKSWKLSKNLASQIIFC